ncbi:kinase-like domain-containing protein [Apodospora peruviana]|uniref:Kinase-like domain-containing protein n=1 Tax=Apodospora peruviana TaxID=516989 RepID=A0AAE0I4D7_9PEZI|nr:kinase-like domain-containing protein [Apodospora peruviana]
MLVDLSNNGAFINETIIGRNNTRQLQEHDEIAILDRARFIFRYPQTHMARSTMFGQQYPLLKQSTAFLQQYTLLERLEKSSWCEVYLCVEKASGQRYAVKIFFYPPSNTTREKLQPILAIPMGVSHPKLLCLKDVFEDHAPDGGRQDTIFMVLELASDGELFNYIVAKEKLTEDENRVVFIQVCEAVKYLHDRNIVHGDIKSENIFMTDEDVDVKVADFGLNTFIQILKDSEDNSTRSEATAMGHKMGDIWSLGVVLCICLCGFPPFSDELYPEAFPYTMVEQIKMGQFDYPSPHWDAVGIPARDLIDSMLVANPHKRFTIDQCLHHPWVTQQPLGKQNRVR